MKINGINLKPISKIDYETISTLINSDFTLQEEFGFKPESVPTGSQVEKDFCDWCNSHSAKMYSTFKDGQFIGLVTLSRIDYDHKSARLGYWLGSKFRQQGHGSVVFKMILYLINTMGITQINGSVNPSNTPSRRLWEKNGAILIETEGKNLEYGLKLAF